MDFRYLKAFYLTGKSGSFSQAARQLRIAQSAVSRQIRLLEEDLGFQLLLRAPGAVSLTPKGADLLGRLGEFNAWAADFEAGGMATVRIAALEGVASLWLPSRLATLSALELDVEVTVGSASTVRRMIEQGDVDLALTSEKVESSLASSVKLFRETFELIAAFDVDLKKLEDYRWLFVDKGSHLHKLTRKEPRRFLRAGSVGALLELVRRGAGIAVLPTHLLAGATGLKRRALPELKDGSIHLATLNYETTPRGVDLVRRALLKE